METQYIMLIVAMIIFIIILILYAVKFVEREKKKEVNQLSASMCNIYKPVKVNEDSRYEHNCSMSLYYLDNLVSLLDTTEHKIQEKDIIKFKGTYYIYLSNTLSHYKWFPCNVVITGAYIKFISTI